MSKFKVGDRVRIMYTGYQGEGLDVGTVHEVTEVFKFGIGLWGACAECNLYFNNGEVEPYTPANTIQLNYQYTSENGHKWECIAVRGDTAWLVAENGKGAAYTFKLDGTNICQGGGEWDIKWEPVVAWVDTKGSWSKAGCHPQRQYIYAIRFPLIDGEPDFTQASVTPV